MNEYNGPFDKNGEEIDAYCILYPENLTAASQRLLTDTGLSLVQIYPLCLEYGEYLQKVRNEGYVASGKEEVTHLSHLLATLAIVSFELCEHEGVAFPVNAAPVTFKEERSKETVIPLIEMKICVRDGTSRETLFRKAVEATESYQHLSVLLAKKK